MTINVGVILITIFSVTVFAVFLQILAAIITRRRTLKLIDEGYYFVEVQVRWRRRELRPVHPNNVDFSNGVLQLNSPLPGTVF